MIIGIHDNLFSANMEHKTFQLHGTLVLTNNVYGFFAVEKLNVYMFCFEMRY